MMESTFWFGVQLGDFIFPGFNVASAKGLAATCIAVGCISLLSEGIKSWLQRRARLSLASRLTPPPDQSQRSSSSDRSQGIMTSGDLQPLSGRSQMPSGDLQPLPRGQMTSSNLRSRRERNRRSEARVTITARVYESLIYLIYLTVSYLLMLAVMGYNVAIFLAVIIGSGIGHAIFHKNSNLDLVMGTSSDLQEEEVNDPLVTSREQVRSEEEIENNETGQNLKVVVHQDS